MHRLVPSLSLLALVTCAGAEVITDDGVKLTVGLLTQARMEIARGGTTSGDAYSPSENSSSGQPDTADFYLRRVRPYLKGTFGDGFIFQTTLAADNAGRNGASPTTVTLFDAWAGRKIIGSAVTHTIIAGKKNAWFYSGNFNQATGLLPSFRPTVPVGAPNQIGLSYRLDSPIIRFGVDVLNNVGTGYANSTTLGAAGDDAVNASQNEGEGLWFSARMEITGTDGWGSPWQESFAGQSGHGFVIGLEAGAAAKDRLASVVAAPGQPGHATATIFGLEGMLHLDEFTAVADIRMQRTAFAADAGTDPDTVSAQTITLQAGYAFTIASALVPVLEPALRYSKIDNNTSESNEGALYGGSDYGASGRQIELGLNAYFNGHKNKLAVEFIHWTGEEASGAGEPTANILRVQHQLWF